MRSFSFERSVSPALVGLIVCACVYATPATSDASGVLVARFGGAHGHTTAHNPTAVYYNPAGLALGSGHRLMVDGTLAHRTASYARPESAIGDARAFSSTEASFTPEDAVSANAGTATLNNQIAAPFIGVASDLGIKNLGVGLALFGPMGGASAWDQNEAYRDNETYPGAVDGVTRWWAMDGSMRSIYLAGSVAYRLESLGLSVGMSVNGILSQLHTIRARNADSGDYLLENESGELKEGRSEINVSGYQYSIGLGLVYEAGKDTYVGLSYQSRPNIRGGMKLSGTLKNALARTNVSESKVDLYQEMADVIRVGFRTRLAASLELRIGTVYAGWSALERQCLVNEGTPQSSCDADLEGGVEDPDVLVILERDWQDAFGVEAGLSYFVSPSLEAFAGAGWDGNAIPDETLEPALLDMNKVTTSLGARYSISESLHLMGTFTQVFYEERTSTSTNQDLEKPSKNPDSSGTYNQSISVLNISVEAGF